MSAAIAVYPTCKLSRRAALATLGVAPLLLASCGSLPAVFAVPTPTPNAPRPARIAFPNLELFQFVSNSLHNTGTQIAPERHVSVELVPIDVAVPGKGIPSAAELPVRFAQQLDLLKGPASPDLVMTEMATLRGLARAGALQDLNSVLRSADWYKADSFLGNVLKAGEVRGKQLALPLNLSIETALYNRKVFQARGFDAPTPGWTWDQAIATAKSLTTSGGPTGRWGFFLTASSPSLFTMGWQRGAQLLSDDGTHLNLTETQTVDGLQLLADLIAVHKVAPPIETQLPRPEVLSISRAFFAQAGSMFQSIAGQHSAMAGSFAGGFAFNPTDSDVRFAPFPAASKQTTLGFAGIMIGIPRNASDPDHSLNALRALLDSAGRTMILPTRKDASELRQIDELLIDSEAITLKAALGSVRVLPGDFPLEVFDVIQKEVMVPVLTGQKPPLAALKEAQALVQGALTTLQG